MHKKLLIALEIMLGPVAICTTSYSLYSILVIIKLSKTYSIIYLKSGCLGTDIIVRVSKCH